MDFWLGVHRAHWLETMGVPLMVSHRILRERKTLPTAIAPWVLDSGGFTELSLNGKWTSGPNEYVQAIDRYASIGQLRWASPQDWMCEPHMLDLTGLSIREHQNRTIDSVLSLRDLKPKAHIIPVLQGWERDDYLYHVNAYASAGLDLFREPVVGLGSVCRRQNMDAAAHIVADLSAMGLRLHGFGFKKTGLRRCWHLLASADSMAWSFRARRDDPLPGCTHKACSNCPRYARRWYQQVVGIGAQGSLFGGAA